MVASQRPSASRPSSASAAAKPRLSTTLRETLRITRRSSTIRQCRTCPGAVAGIAFSGAGSAAAGATGAAAAGSAAAGCAGMAVLPTLPVFGAFARLISS